MSNQSASKSKISRWLWIFCQSSKLCRLQLRNLSSWLCGQMKVIFHTFVLLSGRFLTNGSECFVHTCSYMWMYNIQIYMYIHGDEMICMSQMQCKLSFLKCLIVSQIRHHIVSPVLMCLDALCSLSICFRSILCPTICFIKLCLMSFKTIMCHHATCLIVSNVILFLTLHASKRSHTYKVCRNMFVQRII